MRRNLRIEGRVAGGETTEFRGIPDYSIQRSGNGATFAVWEGVRSRGKSAEVRVWVAEFPKIRQASVWGADFRGG